MKSDSAAPQKKYKSKRQKKKVWNDVIIDLRKNFCYAFKSHCNASKKNSVPKKIILLCCDQAGQFSIIHERKINFLFSKK